MQRIRTIEQPYNEIKQIDSNAAITKNGLRQLIKSGELPSTKIGVKTVISMETLENYLSGNIDHAPKQVRFGTIRAVGI